MPIFESMPIKVIYVLSEHNQFRNKTDTVYQYIRSMHSVLKWQQYKKPGAVCVIKFNQKKQKRDNLLLLSTEYIYI